MVEHPFGTMKAHRGRRLATLAHCFWVWIKALLHSLEQVLVLSAPRWRSRFWPTIWHGHEYRRDQAVDRCDRGLRHAGPWLPRPTSRFYMTKTRSGQSRLGVQPNSLI